MEAVRINRSIETGSHINHLGKEVRILSLNRRGECFAPMQRDKFD